MDGVLLINTGSPAAPTAEAVRGYLTTFLMDKHIRPLPAPLWRMIVTHAIVPRRAEVSAARYRAIWSSEGSPLVAGCTHLAERVAACCAEMRPACTPYVRTAMAFGEPSLATVLAELRDAGCTRVIAIPLYPQTAYSTTGVAADALDQAYDLLHWHPASMVVASGYGDDPEYQAAVAGAVRASGFNPAEDHLLLSFHAIPQAHVRRGDTYVDQVKRSACGIARALQVPSDAWSLSFQSRFEDGRKWTGPFTGPLVEELARTSAKRLVVCCPGFSVDCLETLHDVERELRALYMRTRPDADEAAFRYVGCLNDALPHARLLARLIVRMTS